MIKSISALIAKSFHLIGFFFLPISSFPVVLPLIFLLSVIFPISGAFSPPLPYIGL